MGPLVPPNSSEKYSLRSAVIFTLSRSDHLSLGAGAGGEYADYCDFESSDSFFDAFERAWAKETGPRAVELHGERQNYARAFSWSETYRKIKNAVLERI